MDKEVLSDAVSAILNGKLIVYPTDTLYGLGSSITDKEAVTKIFSIKKRPSSLPLSVAVFDLQMLSMCVELNSLGKLLAHHFFPGKITLVCQKKSVIPSYVTSGNDTVAIRIPDDRVALRIIKQTGPLIATSANIHRQRTPETIAEIRKLFKPGYVEVFVDDGPRSGNPSTIVDVTSSHPMILREGSISSQQILELSDHV